MRSMTGFGVGEAALYDGRLVVEVRATNHRFLDVRVRLPAPLAHLASIAEGALRARVSRGRYDVTAHFEGAALGTPTVDKERARAVFRTLVELRDELAPSQEVPLALLASMPGLFSSQVDSDVAATKSAVEDAVSKALVALDTMRTREGAALQRDVVSRVDRLRTSLEGVAARTPELTQAHKRRLLDRIERLGLSDEIGADGTRVAQEVALFAERIDVTEELTRLHSHLDQAATLASEDQPVGRRLDFLLQEMTREANTIGAKSLDSTMSHVIVEMKADIERIREQVQNVE